MEVKAGHKRTEVGVIPEDWEVKRLDELGVWKGGMTPSMQNPAFWFNGNVPWISSGDVKSALLKKTGFSVTSIAIKQGATTLLPARAIVVVTRGGILRKYLPVAMNVVPMTINQDIKALIPREEFCASFLLHALIGYGNRILARCMKTGTTVESVEFRWLKDFTIPVPSLVEQRAIAKALSDVDALLGALERLVAKKRDLKQAAMQQLLTGQTRLPGFHGAWQAMEFDPTGLGGPCHQDDDCPSPKPEPPPPSSCDVYWFLCGFGGPPLRRNPGLTLTLWDDTHPAANNGPQQSQPQKSPQNPQPPKPLVSPNACLYWQAANWWGRGLGLGFTASGAGVEVGVPLLIVNLASTTLQSSFCSGGGATHW